MHDDDLVTGLQAAVKQEIIEHYLRERLIIEEEVRDLRSQACSFQGGLADRDNRLKRLARSLLLPRTVSRFFTLSGLGAPPEIPSPPSPALCRVPKGWTRFRRFHNLVEHLYRDIHARGQALAAERDKLLALREEVNADILNFERNHDMLTLSTYLCSLDPLEIERRYILGVNFSAQEKAASAAELSFKTVPLAQLGLHPDLGRELSRPRPPEEVMAAAREVLRQLCRSNPCQVDALWADGAGPTMEQL